MHYVVGKVTTRCSVQDWGGGANVERPIARPGGGGTGLLQIE